MSTARAVVCLLGVLGSACASTGLPIAHQRAATPTSTTVTLESWDPALSAALARLAFSPTAEANRQVAREYQRLGVLDQAHVYFTKAVTLDPNDAAALDALARIWRDWGFPERGMTDAQRAVRLVPRSASAANTVGTLFEASGRSFEAREWYERAVRLDPNASYALNNLCYIAIMLSQPDAIARCQRALAASPGSRVARNNLGLAYAAAGDAVSARTLLGRDAVRQLEP
jgi:tetratricopeptide (TPR) repeat protein